MDPQPKDQQVNTQIPLKQICDAELPRLYPQLTPQQVNALRSGQSLNKSDERFQFLATKLDSMCRSLAAILRPPPVACVLVFKDPRRIRQARKAVAQFQSQSHTNKLLVIVNTSGATLLDNDVDNVREIHLTDEEAPTTGRMRNLAVASVKGQVAFVVPHWDDDDLYDAHYLTMLAAACLGQNGGLVLRYQIRVDIPRSTVYVADDPAGHPNTAMIPLLPEEPEDWYEDKTGGEDAAMWAKLRQRCHLVNNINWPLDCLKIAVYTGNNVASREAFMGPFAAEDKAGVWAVSGHVARTVQELLYEFGVITTPVPAGGPKT